MNLHLQDENPRSGGAPASGCPGTVVSSETGAGAPQQLLAAGWEPGEHSPGMPVKTSVVFLKSGQN